MSYKYWLFLALSLLLLITVSFTYFKLHSEHSLDTSIAEAIPATSPVIITMNEASSIEDLIASLMENSFLKDSKLGSRFLYQIETINSLLQVTDMNGTSEIVITIEPTGSKNYDFLYITTYPRLDIYSDPAKEFFISKGYTYDEQLFRNERLLKLSGNDHAVHLFQEDNILVFSFSPVAVEASVLAIKDEEYSFRKNKYYSDILESEENPVMVYLLYEKLNTLTPFVLGDEFRSLKKNISSLADISALKLDITGNEIRLSGHTKGVDKAISALQQENNLKSFLEIIPANSSFFEISNISSVEVKVEEYGFFKNWMSGNYAHFALESFSNTILDQGLLAIEFNDKKIASEDLMELVNITGGSEVVEYKGYNIHTVNFTSFINSLFPSEIVTFDRTEAAFIDGMLVFANSAKGIKKLIDLYISNQVLIYSPEYEMFSSYLGNYASLYTYLNPDRAVKYMSRMFNGQLPGKIGIQFSSLGKEVFTNIVIESTSEGVFTVDDMLWRVPFEESRPENVHVVLNHYTNEKEVLIQDINNQLYLVDNSGNILWKKTIDDQIIGEVHQIDFLNNNKLQMLFITDSLIHLLDRNGNYVDPYPIMLSDKPASGLSVIEYNQRSSIRLFVGGENGNLYGYYKDGKPLPGWNPKKDAGVLGFPLQHLIVDKKDMLLTVSKQGVIHCYNRKGEDRFPPIKTGCTIYQDFSYAIKDKMFTGRTLTNKGLLTISSDGTFVIDSSNRYLDSIPMILSQNDTNQILFRAENEHLTSTYTHGGLKFDYAVPWQVSRDIRVFRIGNQDFIGIASSEAGQIILLDPEGYPLQDFPMNAGPPFMISKINSTNEHILLATDDQGLFAYRLRL